MEKKLGSFWIETYGCEMNVAESNALDSILKREGFTLAEKEEDADFIIVNTCSVRESAENRVWGRLGRLTHLKQEKDITVIFTGCMAERFGELIKTKAPQVDFVVGSNNKMDIPYVLKGIKQEKHPIYNFTKSYYKEGEYSSFIPIMNGCNNFCTYCIVPYVRGREISRDPEEIFEEVKKLDSNGVKEITLLGQNVNSYDYEGMKFPALLEKVHSFCHNIQWIRFESPHPKDFSDDLIDVIARSPRVARHIHLPIQSGSTEVLRVMNRRYDSNKIFSLLNSMREKIPGITFSTDIMVGFPGETEQQFQETIDMMDKGCFIDAFMYYYNKREGTKAVKMSGHLEKQEKLDRLQTLIDFQLKKAAELKKSRAEGIQNVIVTGVSRDDKAMLLGRNEHNEMIAFSYDKPVSTGDFTLVKILGIKGNTFIGSQINE